MRTWNRQMNDGITAQRVKQNTHKSLFSFFSELPAEQQPIEMVCNLRRHHVTVTGRKTTGLCLMLTRCLAWPGCCCCCCWSSSAFLSIQTFCTRAAAATPFFFVFHVVNRVIAAADANGATGATRVLLFTRTLFYSQKKNICSAGGAERERCGECLHVRFTLSGKISTTLRRTDSFVYGAGGV